jgi:multiple sugar transport system substrate-binding protein
MMPRHIALGALVTALALAGCDADRTAEAPVLNWYVFNEPSGAFIEIADRCTKEAGSRYRIVLRPLPADADQQREQLARRLAARDADLDLIGMDVIWTAEFAAAGWIRPWPASLVEEAAGARLPATRASATLDGRLWAAPFTTNAQLLWYRTDRVAAPPATWDEMIASALRLGPTGSIAAQGERYEGLTVLFVSALASAGGAVLSPDGRAVSLAEPATRRALEVLRELGASGAAIPAFSTSREDQARIAFERGDATFMLNYTYVWPSAQRNAPEVAARMAWARWPRVRPSEPSRVTLGGLNIGVAAFSRHPQLAFAAATCIGSEAGQRIAAERGGLPPSSIALYEDPAVRAAMPFIDTLRATLEDAAQRPQTPVYLDVSLAISRVLHPPRAIEPAADVARLRDAVARALSSEGLL